MLFKLSGYEETANELGLYFAQKIANLCDELDLVSMTMNAVPDFSDDSRAPLVFEEFVLLTDDDVCMINTSLELGVFPKDWKEAVVVPSLKKLRAAFQLSVFTCTCTNVKVLTLLRSST